MAKKLVYNKQSSDSMGLVIQATPVYSISERDVSVTHVPGRNGDIITDNGSYKNVNRTYSLAKGYAYGSHPLKTTVKNGQELFEWLTSAKGQYVRLEDDYDPDVYRLATYVGSGSITDIFDKALAFEVTFNCKPQRFLKFGEIAIPYDIGSTSIDVNNITHYEAKPIIKIENIPSGLTANTMMSVKSDDGEEVSLVSFKGDSDSISTININSETEECYYDDETNASDKVSLNGKNFPILKKGNTNISISQYDRSDYEIPSYNTVIQSKQEICESSFSTRETTINSFEDKYNIRSYNSLIAERENMFEADAYFTRLTEICDEGVTIAGKTYAQSYTIEGPSSYLNGITIEFPYKTYDDFKKSFDSYGVSFLKIAKATDVWSEFEQLTPEECMIKMQSMLTKKEKGSWQAYLNMLQSIAAGDGYVVFLIDELKMYRKENNTNVIREYYASDGDLLIWMASPATEQSNDNNKWEFISDFIEELNENELPSYLEVSAITDEDDAVMTIIYSWNLSDYEETESVNIYWKDKVGFTGLMGKAKWDNVVDGQQLVAYNWNWLRKSFIVGGNLLTSGDNFSFRFVRWCSTSEPYMQYNFGANAAKIFSVELLDLSNVKVRSYKKGFYKDSKTKRWNFKSSAGDEINTFEPKESFKIEYLKEYPKYSDERDWPTWLNSKPLCYDNNHVLMPDQNPLLATYFQFIVNMSTYYRKYVTRDDIETNTEFVHLNAGDIFDSSEYVPPEDNITIGRYYSEQWDNPSNVPEFPYDRAISINNTTPSLDPYLPDWLRYEVEMKVKLNSDPTKEIVYTRNRLNTIGYTEMVCIGGTYPEIRQTVYYSDVVEPDVGDSIYEFDEITGLISPVGLILSRTIIDEDSNEINYEIVLDDFTDARVILSNHFYKWTSLTGSVVYTKAHWYANANDKVFDIDNNEIGYVSEEPTIYYYSGKTKGGFYKYDNSNAWVYYEANDSTNPILKTGYKDSTMFYYVEQFPSSYEDYYNAANIWQTTDSEEPIKFTTVSETPEEGDVIYSYMTHEVIGKVVSFEDNILTITISDGGNNYTAERQSRTLPEWIALFDIERLPGGNTNPLSINFKIKNDASAGYYKANSLVHWKHYNNGDIVLSSLVNETNTISHLVPKQDNEQALSNVRITVTPNWWML